MNDLSTVKTRRAGNSVPSGRRSELVRWGPVYIIYFVLFGILAGASQTGLAEDDPHELFVKSCATCHGKDGKAQTPAAKKLGVKDLSQSKLADAQIVQQITEGKQATQDSAKMPAFNERLTPEQIQSLVPVVKEFRK